MNSKQRRKHARKIRLLKTQTVLLIKTQPVLLIDGTTFDSSVLPGVLARFRNKLPIDCSVGLNQEKGIASIQSIDYDVKTGEVKGEVRFNKSTEYLAQAFLEYSTKPSIQISK